MAQAFYARTAEMAVRMATIRAAGIYPHSPKLDEESMLWGPNWRCGARRRWRGVRDRDLKDIIRALADAEEILIEKITPEREGTPSVWYSATA